MQKTAQKRSLLNKLKEMTDVGGIATEKYFSPEFKQVMDQLREVDDGIRTIASGEQVGEASIPADAISLKDILKSVKSNVNRREYMKSIADLGRFHKKMFDIVHLISLFNYNVDKIHERFLFQDLDEDSKKHLQYFKNKWSKTSSYKTLLIKEANILDFFTNIATERGRALSSWEKRYPNKIKKLKIDVGIVLSSSEKNLNILLSVLKDMAKARASRNPDAYVAVSSKVINNFKSYDDMFQKFYDEHVKGFLEKQEFFAPTKVDTTNIPKNLGEKNVIESPIQPPSGGKIPLLPSIPQLKQPSSNDITIKDAPPFTVDVHPTTGEVQIVDPITGEIQADDTITSEMQVPQIQDISKMKSAPAHRKFIESLQAMSEESPILLRTHISRYAKSIFANDPNTSLKLFKIVKSIKG